VKEGGVEEYFHKSERTIDPLLLKKGRGEGQGKFKRTERGGEGKRMEFFICN